MKEALDLLVYLFAYLAAAAGLSAMVTLAIGRATKWRQTLAPAFCGGAAVPMLLVGYLIYLRNFTPDGPSPNDGKGLAIFVLIAAIGFGLPITVPTSVAIARRYHHRTLGEAKVVSSYR